jgi:AcrR family transcriptional regulator
MDAIAELTSERGYEATKIADIVGRAGVARKTLYDNFDGKEDVFLAAFETATEDLETSVEEACRSGGDWQDGVKAGLAALLGAIAERPATARLCLIEALSATPASAARYESTLERFVGLLRRATPRDTGLPETIEETLVGGVAWILSQQMRRGEGQQAANLLPELSEFVLSPYLGVSDPNRVRGDETDSTVADSNG